MDSLFPKYGYKPDVYREESIVDLVKRHKAGEKIFPEGIDVVTGGFPCQDFSVAGKRNGFNFIKITREKLLKGILPRRKPVVSYICG